MNLSEVCIRRPVLTTLITASFIVFGIFAYRLLPVAALPARRFPDHQHHRNAAGREPGNHGGLGRRRRSSGSCRPSPASRSMTSSSSLGHHLDHHPVRSQPQHRRRGARRADRARHRAAPPAGRDDDAAELPQGQPGRLPDPSHFSCSRIRCRCRRSTTMPSIVVGATDFAAAGRRPGAGLRRAEIRGPCPGRSGSAAARAASRSTTSAARSPRPIRNSPVGTLVGPAAEHYADGIGRQIDKAAEYRQGRGCLAQRRAGQARRSRAASSTASRTTRSRAGSTTSARSCSRSSASPTPTRWPSSMRSRTGCRLCARRFRPSIDMRVADRPLDLDPRIGRRRAGDAAHRRRARDPGDLPVPAQDVGDHHSGAGGAGLDHRHLRGDVCVRITRSTT